MGELMRISIVRFMTFILKDPTESLNTTDETFISNTTPITTITHSVHPVLGQQFLQQLCVAGPGKSGAIRNLPKYSWEN